ncbi:MAG: tetratricopeptide repeat protein [Cyclobacteriaceae bacterium]|nr:tetratricopeptide repeat protein [Cyclobacteriaceae bacterium]
MIDFMQEKYKQIRMQNIGYMFLCLISCALSACQTRYGNDRLLDQESLYPGNKNEIFDFLNMRAMQYPEEADFSNRYISFLLENGRREEARQFAERAGNFHPYNGALNLMLARFYYEEGDPSNAREHLKRITQLDDEADEYYWLYARLALDDNNTQAAIEYIDKALNIHETDYRLRDTRGDILLAKGDTSAAEEWWQRSLEIEGNLNVIKKLISTTSRQQNYTSTTDYIKAGLEIDPENEFILNHYAELMRHSQQRDSALSVYSFLHQLYPMRFEYPYQMSDIYFENGRSDSALVWNDKALMLQSEAYNAWMLRTRILERSGRVYEAMNAVRKALESDSTSLEAKNLLWSLQRRATSAQITRQREELKKEIESIKTIQPKQLNPFRP